MRTQRSQLPFWNPFDLPWLDRLAEAGVAPDQIDLVVHTHLHADHVGWDTHLVEGEWRPLFTGARHVYVGEKTRYWRADAQRVGEDVYADSPPRRAGCRNAFPRSPRRSRRTR